jgi:imidazolonepropionase-like amidohydrolase
VRLRLALLLLCASCARRSDAPTLVITHVTVVDVRTGDTHPDQTVFISGPRVTRIGRSRDTPPAGVELIDGTGMFLVPGLWDMHVHLDQDDLPALLRLGITGARDMGGDLDALLEWRRRLAAGELNGPRLVFGGQPIRGAMTAEQGTQAVGELHDRGADFIKVHEGLARETYFAVVRDATARGLAVAGHVPAGITPREVAESGQKTIEHVEFVPDRCLPIFSAQDPPGCSAAIDSVLDAMDENGTWLDPTIGSFRIFAARQFPQILAGFTGLVPRIRARGIQLLAGTDLGTRGIVPGASLHDELDLLVRAGFARAEVLRAATLNPAIFLGLTDSLGTIEEGKIADVLLLAGNPLDDIKNTRAIGAVIQRGKVVFRK